MKATLKKYFIPHEENGYHPHFLHTKRHVMYGSLAVAMKLILIGFAVLVPQEVYVTPDVLSADQKEITRLTNEFRARQALNQLDEESALLRSSEDKVEHMVQYEYFAHVGPDGKDLSSFLLGANYDYQVGGENLAMGFATPKEIVNAWIDSPTHYANLVDTKYQDIGISMNYGEFDGFPTVYVAQHFGVTRNPEPVTAIVQAEPEPTSIAQPAPEPTQESETVLGTQTEEPAPAPQPEPSPRPKPEVVEDLSEVAWADAGKNETKITVTATLSGSVDKATLSTGGKDIPLEKQPSGEFTAEATVPVSSDKLFTVPVPPSITMETNGEITHDIVPWANVKFVQASLVRQYNHAKSSLGAITALFDITRDVYIFFILLFSLALILKIFIEIRTQHVHVIVKTLSLLLLLTGLALW